MSSPIYNPAYLTLHNVKSTVKIPSIFVAFLENMNMFSKKATKIDEIFTVDLTPCSKRQIDGEDFVNFSGLLRKYELYNQIFIASTFPELFSPYMKIGW